MTEEEADEIVIEALRLTAKEVLAMKTSVTNALMQVVTALDRICREHQDTNRGVYEIQAELEGIRLAVVETTMVTITNEQGEEEVRPRAFPVRVLLPGDPGQRVLRFPCVPGGTPPSRE